MLMSAPPPPPAIIERAERTCSSELRNDGDYASVPIRDGSVDCQRDNGAVSYIVTMRHPGCRSISDGTQNGNVPTCGDVITPAAHLSIPAMNP